MYGYIFIIVNKNLSCFKKCSSIQRRRLCQTGFESDCDGPSVEQKTCGECSDLCSVEIESNSMHCQSPGYCESAQGVSASCLCPIGYETNATNTAEFRCSGKNHTRLIYSFAFRKDRQLSLIQKMSCTRR